VFNIAQHLSTDFGCEKHAFLEEHARSRAMKISARSRGRHITIYSFIISSHFHLTNLITLMQNFSLLLYPVNSRFLFLWLMLDVVTINSRVSGHLLVLSRPSRGVPRKLSSFRTLVTPFSRGTLRSAITHVVPRSRLSQDYSR